MTARPIRAGRAALLCVVAASVIMSGCETLNPYTDEPETSRATNGKPGASSPTISWKAT